MTLNSPVHPANAVADPADASRPGFADQAVLIQAFEHCPVSVMITDCVGKIEYVNPRFSAVTGYSLEEVRGKNPRILKSGKTTNQDYSQLWTQVLAGGEWTGEFHNRRKDGSLFWERAVIAGLRDEAGSVTRLIAIKEDITQQKATIEELEFERVLLRALLDTFPDSIYFKDLHSRFLRIGRSMAESIGLDDCAEAFGKCDRDFFEPAVAAESLADEQQIIRTGRSLVGKIEKVTCNGKERSFRVTKLPLRSTAGKIFGTFGISSDVTNRLHAERTLRESEAKFRAVSQSSQFAIIMLRMGGFVTFWNAAATRLFGYREDEVLERKLPQLAVPGPNTPDFLQAFDLVCRTGERTFDGRILALDALTKDGKSIPVEVSLASFQVEGEWFGTAVVQDVSARRRMQDERAVMQIEDAQAQKLESIGRLASGIAHEINTPTQYVGDNLNFLRTAIGDMGVLLKAYAGLRAAASEAGVCTDMVRQVESLEKKVDLDYLITEIPSAIEQSLDGVSRVSSIVCAMKNYSHPDAAGKNPVNLNAAIESTVTVARSEWKYVAELDLDLEPSLPLVPCLAGEFNQVILNLVINAAHAIGEKTAAGGSEMGRISVSTRSRDGWVEIRIADTGAGIPQHVRDKLFTPFFTTKPAGKGTGQGLAMARAVIVEKHGGTIHFESEESVGTCFIIRLPLEESGGAEERLSA